MIVLLNDISVSRLHCFLKINKRTKKLHLSDNNSKFGTLALIQTNHIILVPDLALHLQVGRSYLKILIKKYVSFFNCCGVSEKKNSDFYYLQNYDVHKFENKLTVKTDYETNEGMEIENKLEEFKDNDENKNNDELMKMKTKINLMEDNDIDGLLLNSPAINTNENNININNINDLIDEESVKENKKDENNDNNDKESILVVKDD